jgi:hypothetical protein
VDSSRPISGMIGQSNSEGGDPGSGGGDPGNEAFRGFKDWSVQADIEGRAGWEQQFCHSSLAGTHWSTASPQ